jgi:diguanylate cyclase (GGDEF)-like protein
MSLMTNQSYLEQLGELRANYARKVHGKIREVEEAWDAAYHRPGDRQAFERVGQLLHNMIGASGTFGFSGVCHAARSLKDLLSASLQNAVPPGEALAVQVRPLLALMKRAAATPDQGGDLVALEPAEEETAPVTQLIYLVDDDPEQAQNLAAQIRHFGYDVKVFGTVDEARRAVDEAAPAAIIMDMILKEGDVAGAQAVAEFRNRRNVPIPSVFVSVRGDLAARLEAVRVGASAYFTKPADIGKLVGHLDHLTARRRPDPYRVFIVDDDAMLSRFLSTSLRQAGMVTVVVNDPLTAMDHLAEFTPDLILLDVHMPGCTGPELAAVIRQHPEYVSTPIVFLSSENEIRKQIEARSVGADDFLTKPITPARLVSEVSLRAHRSRALRSHVVRDGQTGLLNHTASRVQLEHELARARRTGGKVAFAVIDVDDFKQVNDTHGHLAGDRVLRSLAHLLEHRLRRSDIVGRYGGDEFVAILPDADEVQAARVMEEARAAFARIEHPSYGHSFGVNLSIGVAAFPDRPDAARLIERADQRLYAAKREGGNRVKSSD